MSVSSSGEMAVVVIGVKEGAPSEAAFLRALRLFPHDSTEFHIVHVRPPKDDAALATISWDFKRYSRQLEMQRQRHSQKLLGRFQVLAEKAGVTFKLVELTAHAIWSTGTRDYAEALCKYCTRVDAEALVLGARCTSFPKRILKGSVNQHCMLHAQCPVLTDHQATPSGDKHGVDVASAA